MHKTSKKKINANGATQGPQSATGSVAICATIGTIIAAWILKSNHLQISSLNAKFARDSRPQRGMLTISSPWISAIYEEKTKLSKWDRNESTAINT